MPHSDDRPRLYRLPIENGGKQATGKTPLSYDASTCANCAADIHQWNEAGFIEKLVAALKHPIADVRMRAIIVLGNRHEPLAAIPLTDCALAHRTDVIEGLAVVDSLVKIREVTGSDGELERISIEHAAKAVREAAQRALDQKCAGIMCSRLIWRIYYPSCKAIGADSGRWETSFMRSTRT